MAVRIVTDSTADIPPALAQELGISVVPLTIFFGEESFLDGVELDASTFMTKLTSSAALPRTTQPSPAAFSEVYQAILAEGHQICSIHISAKLSGTYQSASLARDESGKPDDVAIVDSGWTSMALGFIAIRAARAAREGASLQEVVQITEDMQSGVDLILFCDTLEYLQRGGRIGRAAALFGGLLKVKPILTLRDGVVAPVERVRTRSRALDNLWNWAQSFPQLQEYCVLYSGASDDAEALHQRIQAHFPQATAHLAPTGPIIATHLGPDAMGIVVVP